MTGTRRRVLTALGAALFVAAIVASLFVAGRPFVVSGLAQGYNGGGTAGAGAGGTPSTGAGIAFTTAAYLVVAGLVLVGITWVMRTGARRTN
jgi:hypothetical protein